MDRVTKIKKYLQNICVDLKFVDTFQFERTGTGRRNGFYYFMSYYEFRLNNIIYGLYSKVDGRIEYFLFETNKENETTKYFKNQGLVIKHLIGVK